MMQNSYRNSCNYNNNNTSNNYANNCVGDYSNNCGRIDSNYTEKNCVNNSNYNSSKKELFEIICHSSFALDDIKLFLDTHPCDVEALKCYEEYKKIRNVAIMEYTREYGPLSAYDVNVCNKWTWIDSPWPWEGVC